MGVSTLQTAKISAIASPDTGDEERHFLGIICGLRVTGGNCAADRQCERCDEDHAVRRPGHGISPYYRFIG